jgi:hypothetical protein
MHLVGVVAHLQALPVVRHQQGVEPMVAYIKQIRATPL